MIKKVIRRIVLGYRCDTKTFINYLRHIGCSIGERVEIFNPNSVVIDTTRPWLISIGNDVQITKGVTILTHGYDWAVLKGVYGEVLGSSGGVQIGNNVFVGMNTTILKGVHVGNNVIIGANSLVNKDLPDNCVAAGNPCRIIMDLDTYHEKRKQAQIAEATELVQLYRRAYGKEPGEMAFREYFWLFSNNPDELPEVWKKVNKLVGNEQFTNEVMKKNKKQYLNMNEFLKSII